MLDCAAYVTVVRVPYSKKHSNGKTARRTSLCLHPKVAFQQSERPGVKFAVRACCDEQIKVPNPNYKECQSVQPPVPQDEYRSVHCTCANTRRPSDG